MHPLTPPHRDLYQHLRVVYSCRSPDLLLRHVAIAVMFTDSYRPGIMIGGLIRHISLVKLYMWYVHMYMYMTRGSENASILLLHRLPNLGSPSQHRRRLSWYGWTSVSIRSISKTLFLLINYYDWFDFELPLQRRQQQQLAATFSLGCLIWRSYSDSRSIGLIHTHRCSRQLLAQD